MPTNFQQKQELSSSFSVALCSCIPIDQPLLDGLPHINNLLQQWFGQGCSLWLTDSALGKGNMDLLARHAAFDRAGIHAANHAVNIAAGTGKETVHMPEASHHFQPIIWNNGVIGLLALARAPENLSLSHQGYIAEIQAIFSAITSQSAALMRTMNNDAMYQQKNKLNAALLSSMSHDLKTPLVSIIGSLSALRHMGDNLDENSRKTLIQTAHEEAEHLNRFITNLLDMTKLESGTISLNREWIDPEELLTRVVRRLHMVLGKHRLKHVPSEIPCTLYIDVTLMEQVLQNLLDNATKYAPEGSTITVTFSCNAHGGYIAVSDQGAGIPPSERERVFEKFFRLKNKETINGTGLGLAICKAIIEAHEGSVSVGNNPEQSDVHYPGTTVLIYLPKTKEQETPEGHIEKRYA